MNKQKMKNKVNSNTYFMHCLCDDITTLNLEYHHDVIISN
jgi:hypothetical protein